MTSVRTKISEFSAANGISGNSLIVFVDSTETSANNKTKSITINNLLGNNSSNTVSALQNLRIVNQTTPANSTSNALVGTMWFDTNYIYVAVANNTIKRVSLGSF